MYLNPRKSLHKIEKIIANNDTTNTSRKEEFFNERLTISEIKDIGSFNDYYTLLLKDKNIADDALLINVGKYSSSDFFTGVWLNDCLKGLVSFKRIMIDSGTVLVINNILLSNSIIGKKENDNDVFLSEALFSSDYESNVFFSFRMFLDNENIQAVFYELEKLDLNIESFLHDIDAKWIPLSSIETLTKKSQINKLLCFPQLVGDVFKINNHLIEEFFGVYYPSVDKVVLAIELEKITYENDAKMSPREKFIYLNQVPQKENPIINFRRLAICLEILVDDDYLNTDFLINTDKENIKENHNFSYFLKDNNRTQLDTSKSVDEFLEKNGYCIFTHSYEVDLFSFKYQTTPPYYTKNYTIAQPFTISFLSSTEFISEGRKESIYVDNSGEIESNLLEMKGYANYTYFFNSRIRVWHLVLIPSKSITEIQVIKIMKIFSGIQESGKATLSNQDNNHNSEIFNCGEIRCDWKGLFQYITGIKYKFKDNYSLDKALNSGIVAIDMNYNDYNVNNKQVEILKKEIRDKFNDIHTIIQNNEGDLSTTNKNTEKVFKALCGITLGILDFDRMGIEEISDTLAPREQSITPSSFLTLNRGVLTSFALGDDVFNSAWKTLGINPYLMIPSAVLAHNDFISRDAEQRLNHTWNLCSDKSGIRVKINHLIDERNYIDDLINDDILANVFQYPTERELYDYGMKHRGINDRILEVKNKLIQLDKIIEQKQLQKANANDKIIQSVLTFLSLLQIASFATDFGILKNKECNDCNNMTTEHKGIIIIILLLASILGYFIFLSNTAISFKLKKKKEKLYYGKTKWLIVKELVNKIKTFFRIVY